MMRVIDFYHERDDIFDGLRLFNTFRIGDNWDLIEPGELLAVYLNDDYVGPMVVGATDSGPLVSMMFKHAALNTTCINMFSNDLDTMVGRLWTVLSDFYGSMLTMRGSPTVVMHLINPRVLNRTGIPRLNDTVAAGYKKYGG